MLEAIIAEKTQTVIELENQLAKEQADNCKLELGLKEKSAVLESYEKRFIGVRSLIERQDSELKDSFAKLNELKEQLHLEEQKSRRLEGQILETRMASQGELDEVMAKMHDVEHQCTGRLEKQTRDFERQLAEKERWCEALKT